MLHELWRSESAGRKPDCDTGFRVDRRPAQLPGTVAVFPQPATAELLASRHHSSVILGSGRSRSPSAPPPSWRGVFFEGPESAQDHEGEEVPVWYVFVGDKDAEPVGKVYRCNSFAPAQSLARRMPKARKLELIQEAVSRKNVDAT
jgi:hypothetical protein